MEQKVDLEQIRKEIKEIYDSFCDYNNLEEVMRKYLKIRSEEGKMIPFKINTAQRKILDIIIPLLLQNKPIRLIILKARQQGISTLIQSLFFLILYTMPNYKALTMGHELRASNNLFDIYDTYYKELPPFLQPKLEYSNEKKKKFLANKSENRVATANNYKVGRSDTFQLVHLTEVAFYEQQKKVLSSIFQASKFAKMIVIESTANGIGDEFYNMYQTAKEKSEYSEYLPVFLSWLDFPSYTKPFTTDSSKKELLSDLGSNPIYNEYENEEGILQKYYNATLEQLNWRRYMIVNYCQKDVKIFHQEYPRDDIEAFLSTDRQFFNAKVCNENFVNASKRESSEYPLIGNLYPVYNETKEYFEQLNSDKNSYYDLKKYLKGVKFIKEPGGIIKLFSPIDHDPETESNRYCAGVDVAEGLEQGDYSCAKILDRKTKNVVITLHCHLDPDLLAEEIHKLQVFLHNDVYFGIERNNHGLSVIYACFKLKVNLYYSENFNHGYPETTDYIGFRTTSASRTPALNNLNEYIRDGEYTDYEKEFWSEAITFVKNAKGKLQANKKDKDPSVKCYDDRIFASMIMLKVHSWLPNYKVKEIDDSPRWFKEEIRQINEYINDFMAV